MIKKGFITLLLYTSLIMSQDYTIKLITGNEISVIIPLIAQQWVDENALYPYLFKGDVAASAHYFQKWIYGPHAAIVVAFDKENNLVGFLSGTSLAHFAQHWPSLQELFEKASLDLTSFYYCSDIIIVPAHRKQGLSRKFFELLENHARSLGYTKSCLVCESHPEGHPLKPKDYYELDNIWQKFGYQKTDIVVSFPWDTIQPDGSVKMQEHEMDCWVKKICKDAL